ncbi:peptidoglycan editing factor PgeF [Acidicapsa dinghuensis]|uniref:Purine nucleoside phosphorylase n=1 Tax=Acidicapsa dinghuensis TaxID=2218256 RepID=A0ABW1EIT5_9BACT|nr:peptidoglycan editing factor PgeF [Acidicapsa dinghuensis]
MTIPDGLITVPGGVAYINVSQWDTAAPWLWHGFSTRRAGVSTAYSGDSPGNNMQGELNLGFTAADPRENVQENRSRFVEAITGSRRTPLITLRQIHSNRSFIVDDMVAQLAATGTTQAHEADGLITSQTGVLIGIQTADCIPVLVADRKHRVVGAFHAGWRGTVRRIVELGVARMRHDFNADPAEMIAAIGPGISACCYSVGDEVRKEFREQFGYADGLFVKPVSPEAGELRLNLIEANRRQLLDAGLSSGSIAIVGGCTGCQQAWFYSHRASHGHTGRIMAVIGIH